MVKPVSYVSFLAQIHNFSSKFAIDGQLLIYQNAAQHPKHGVQLWMNFFLPTIHSKFRLVHLLALQA